MEEKFNYNHIIFKEQERQNKEIELIASENFTSRDVMEALGSCLTNKYAEGYPGKRYYGGCEVVDEAEVAAQNFAKELFNCKFANVQPHSGSQANAAAYMAILEPGDKVVAMSLDHGGHITHGLPISSSGKLYEFSHYGVDEYGDINYDRVEQLVDKVQPKLLLAGYSAHSKQLNLKELHRIAKKNDCLLMIDMAHFAGFVAAKMWDNPCDYADVVTTTTHKTLRGPRGGMILTNDEALAKKIDSAVFPGTQGGPLMNVILAKAVCFDEATRPQYREYMEQVLKNAKAMAQEFEKLGVAVIGRETENHMMLIDTLTTFKLTGKDAEKRLLAEGITVNKNTIPNDTKSPFVTSGIRIGTPAMTTKGWKEFDAIQCAQNIYKILKKKI